MSDGPPTSDPNPLAVLSPPHWVITDDDHGPYVIIATWTMMCFMIFTVTARLARKISIRAWGLDDYLITLATAFGLIQCAVIHRAVVHGLGQRVHNVSAGNLNYYNKATYAFNMLFVATLVLAKVSLIHFITRLTPNISMTRACYVLYGLVITWGVGTILGIAFECPRPTPWNTAAGLDSCPRQTPILYSTAAIDLVTDIAITAFPMIMMWDVQIPRSQRLTVMAVFLVRILVPLAEVPRLIYIHRYLASTDPTFSSVDLAIWTQAVTNLSLATACIPCLKPFLAALGSGVLDTRLPTGFESRVDYTLNSNNLNSNSGSGNHTGNGTRSRSNLNFYGGGKTSQIRTNIEGQGGNDRERHGNGGTTRSESKTRLTEGKPDDHIYRTTEFVMDVDDSPPGTRNKKA